MIDIQALRGKHITILGSKGSGKTHFAKFLMAREPAHLVIDINEEYSGFNRYVPSSFDSQSLAKELEILINRVVIPNKDKIKMLVIDESDMFLPNKQDLTAGQRALLNLNRHWDMETLFLSRRPALLNTNVISLSNYLACFSLIEKRDIDRISSQYPQMKEAFTSISQANHNFIWFDGSNYSIEKV